MDLDSWHDRTSREPSRESRRERRATREPPRSPSPVPAHAPSGPPTSLPDSSDSVANAPSQGRAVTTSRRTQQRTRCQLGSRAPSQRAAANRATTVADCRGGCCESGRQAGRGGGPAAARWGCCAFGRRCPSIVRARGSIKKSQLGPGGGGEDKNGRGRLNQPFSTTRALFKRFYGNKNPDDDWPAFRETGLAAAAAGLAVTGGGSLHI